jgi:hypothetical protein
MTEPSEIVWEVREDFDLAHSLIQEAKGVHDPNGGGYATDHLDAAENHLDAIERAYEALTKEIETLREGLRLIEDSSEPEGATTQMEALGMWVDFCRETARALLNKGA